MTANKDDEVEIKAADKHLIHVRIEDPNFDSKTGKRNDIPFVQNFYPDEFDAMDAAGAFQGKTVTVVHEPEGKTPRLTKTNTEGNENTDGKDGGSKDGKEKPVSRMNKAELFAKYKEIYGEDADKESTNTELADAINEGLEKNKNPLDGQK